MGKFFGFILVLIGMFIGGVFFTATAAHLIFLLPAFGGVLCVALGIKMIRGG